MKLEIYIRTSLTIKASSSLSNHSIGLGQGLSRTSLDIKSSKSLSNYSLTLGQGSSEYFWKSKKAEVFQFIPLGLGQGYFHHYLHLHLNSETCKSKFTQNSSKVQSKYPFKIVSISSPLASPFISINFP